MKIGTLWTARALRVGRPREGGSATNWPDLPTGVSLDEVDAQLFAWLESRPELEGGDVGRAVESSAKVSFWSLLGLGLLAGWAATGVIRHYDGSHPVNVLVFLGGLIFLPWALFLVALCLWNLPRGDQRGQVGGLGGWIWGHWLDRLTRSWQERHPRSHASLMALKGDLARAGGSFAEVPRALGWMLSQWFGLAFQTGVLTAFLLTVFTSDVTFSWSTTLEDGEQKMERLVHWMGLPWQGWLPGAGASESLIQATRYNRFDHEFASADPEIAFRAGAWWPFLAMALVVYGWLPRALAFSVAAWKYRQTCQQAWFLDEELRAIRDRMLEPCVASEGEAEPVSLQHEEASVVESVSAMPSQTSLSKPLLVLYGFDEEPGADWKSQVLGIREGDSPRLCVVDGGPESEAAVLDRIKSETADRIRVVFEPFMPPMAGVIHFLRELRSTAGSKVPIEVTLSWEEDGVPGPVEASDLDTWGRSLRALGDPLTVLLTNASFGRSA